MVPQLIGEQGNDCKTQLSRKLTKIKFPHHVTRIFAGGESCGALDNRGQLYLWGSNYNGNLGLPTGTSDIFLVPTMFDPAVLVRPGEVRNGEVSQREDEDEGLMNKPGKNLVGGGNSKLPAGKGVVLPRVVDVALSSYHTLFLTADGSVYSAGQGRCGKLGLGTLADCANLPQKITGLPPVVQVSCSDFHSAACSREEVFTWGNAGNGKLGQGLTDTVHRVFADVLAPRKVC